MIRPARLRDLVGSAAPVVTPEGLSDGGPQAGAYKGLAPGVFYPGSPIPFDLGEDTDLFAAAHNVGLPPHDLPEVDA